MALRITEIIKLLIIIAIILFLQKRYEHFSSSSIRLFDYHVYWINLDDANDRKNFMTNLFNKYNINNTRISGVNGPSLSNRYIRTICNGLPYRSKSEVGCLLSHIKAIKKAYNDGQEQAIIMEDDICIDVLEKSGGSLERTILQAPLDWEIIQLHYSNPHELKKLLTDKRIFVEWQQSFYSTGCYIINKKGMEKLLQNSMDDVLLTPNANFAVADDYIYRQCKTYTYTKPLFLHTAGESHIHEGEHVSVWHNSSKQLILDYLGLNKNDVCK
jgi:GR25 family glycosyltransferase involved in LPS biosynthesis